MVHSLDIRYIDYISTDFRGRFKLLTSFAALQKLAGLPSLALYTLFLPTANRRMASSIGRSLRAHHELYRKPEMGTPINESREE